MPDKNLTIVIPGLFEGLNQWPENNSENEFATHLCWFMTKASKIRHPHSGFEETLMHTLSSRFPASEELPTAILRENLSKSAVICADPISIEFGVTDINLVHGNDLELTPEEIRRLERYLNLFFEQEEMRLSIDTDGYGTLELQSEAEISTTPLSSVAGQIYIEKLPQGPHQQRWHRLSNEIQMLLHECDFNLERQAKGKLPVNALWIWGGGTNLPDFDAHYDRIYASDAFSQLLARTTKTRLDSVPDSIFDLAQDNRDIDVLVVMDQLWRLSQANDYSGWIQQLQVYEEQWFRPLLQESLYSRYNRINFRSTTGDLFVFRPRHRIRFWKLPRTLRRCQQN